MSATMLQLESMAVEMPEVEGHPNRRGFRGVLTTVDSASDRPPSGARGHRVMLLGRAVEKALPTLLGMAVDYTPTLDGHDARCKVGVITSAELVAGAKEGQAKGQRIEIAGFLYAKDFPEIVGEIEERGPQAMGMSYEIAEVRVADANASVWAITDFKFTGAALLLREKAAYSDTWVSVN